MARFERLVETVVDWTMVSRLRGRIQPIEIAKRLERALREGALSQLDSQIAPNEYVVRLNPAEYSRLSSARETLEREFARHISRRAASMGYSFLTLPTVRLEADDTVSSSGISVTARVREPQVPTGTSARPARRPPPAASPTAASWSLRIDNVNYSIPDRPVRLGRASDCDIVLPSTSVSRYHAELTRRPDGILVRDLGSTNGTSVGGSPIRQTLLKAGDRITFGSVQATVHPGA